MTRPPKKDGTRADLKQRTQLDSIDYSKIEFTDEQIDHARRVVAGAGRDAQDTTELLMALGLMPDQGEWYGRDTQE